ncbi:CHASE3 domain-containing protein [Muricoccus radiodurans]|uniref:CHASE3 domain-containing protein n=1 Tax=Muricoccus radiodurans TaxID=2231721 RepID=UPI003CEDCE78
MGDSSSVVAWAADRAIEAEAAPRPRWRDRLAARLRRLASPGVLLGVLVTLAGAGLTWGYNESLRAGRERLLHSQQVLLTTQRIQILKEGAEAAERGYLLTGEDRFLTPFRPALDELPAAVARLRGFVGNDRAQAARVARLEILAATRIAELSESVELRRRAGLRAAREALLRPGARDADDQLVATLEEIKAAERALRETRTHEVRLMERFLIVVGLLTGLLTFGTRAAYKALRRRRERHAAAALSG